MQDFMRIDPSPEPSRKDILTDLYVLAAYDPGAEHRSGDEVADWLQNTGFHDLRKISLPSMALILAEALARTSICHRSSVGSPH